MVPTLTFIATPNSISHSGARPWLVDVSADSWMLDLDLCRSLILSETARGADGLRRHIRTGEVLRAIMPVMVMGGVVDLDAVVALAREFGLKVVVDAAAAIGTSMADGRQLGATGVDALCYSFNGNKTITTGGGGAVAAADDDLIRRIKHLSSTGRVGANYDHDVIAYNFRMTNVQAALGARRSSGLRVSSGASVKSAIDMLNSLERTQSSPPFRTQSSAATAIGSRASGMAERVSTAAMRSAITCVSKALTCAHSGSRSISSRHIATHWRHPRLFLIGSGGGSFPCPARPI